MDPALTETKQTCHYQIVYQNQDNNSLFLSIVLLHGGLQIYSWSNKKEQVVRGERLFTFTTVSLLL